MGIQDQLTELKNSLPEEVTLIAVSKTKSADEIMQAYGSGHRIFGENKVQELVWKQEELPKDIEWHLIGHLQSNKVKYVAPFVSMIHGIDSLKLLKEVNKRGGQNDRVIDCLLQVHIAEESTKFGFDANELINLLKEGQTSDLAHVRIRGLMGMATYTSDEEQVKKEFRSLSSLFNELKEEIFKDDPDFNVKSMGMSGDYTLAIEEGSTMVRVGSKIFGTRN